MKPAGVTAVAIGLGVGVMVGSLSAGCGGAAAEAGPSPARSPGATAETAPEAAEVSAAGVGGVERGGASYYADSLAGRPTASGEPYSPGELTAAHKTLPFGAMIEVARADGRKVMVRVNDRGPFRKGRVVDVSKRAAEKLGMVREGVVEVTVRVVSLPPPKASKKKRKR